MPRGIALFLYLALLEFLFQDFLGLLELHVRRRALRQLYLDVRLDARTVDAAAVRRVVLCDGQLEAVVMEHRHDDLITKVAGAAYNPNAKAPTWERFITEIMDGDAELIEVQGG